MWIGKIGSSLQFFDISNNLIFSRVVAPGIVSNQGLSFLGAIGNAGEEISRVRIISGNVPSLMSSRRDGRFYLCGA